MDYVNFNIEINEDQTIVASSDGDTSSGQLVLDEQEIVHISSQLADPKHAHKVVKGRIKTLGTKLASALFTQDIKDHFYRLQREAGNKGVRVRLTVKDPKVGSYPWEALYENNRYLAVDVQTPLTRSIPSAPVWKADMKRPIKILVVGANPSVPGVPAARTEQDIQIIEEALKDQVDSGTVSMTTERLGTVAHVMKHLEHDQYNIFHFIGHGIFDNGTGYLVFESEDGQKDLADHERVAQILVNQRSMGLVVLNACQGAATTTTSEAFTGLAPELVRKRVVPCVIAMRYEITNQTAHLFSQGFYPNLLRFPIDESFQRVRHKISVHPDANPGDFLAPALFFNAPDGVVFNPVGPGAAKLAEKPPLREKIEEITKRYEELKSGKGTISPEGFWDLILDLDKGYRGAGLDQRLIAAIKKMIIRVPRLIIERNEAYLSGYDVTVSKRSDTIRANFEHFIALLSETHPS